MDRITLSIENDPIVSLNQQNNLQNNPIIDLDCLLALVHQRNQTLPIMATIVTAVNRKNR
jgi:hypothetical protein